ncbi:MAG: type II secretion system F family protein [Fusobacteriaceae bacterium]
MNLYKYIAYTKNGVRNSGKIKAKNLEELQFILREKNLIFFTSSICKNSILNFFSPTLNKNSLIIFTKELSFMLNSGLPLLESLNLQIKESSNSSFISTLETIVEDVESGFPFYQALGKHKSIFSSFYISLVKVGEYSAQLPVVLNSLALELLEHEKLKKKFL